MAHRGPLLICCLLAALPLFAQQSVAPARDERITKLEQKLDELLRQAEAIRTELQQLQSGAESPAPVAEQTPPEDLTAIDVATPPATAAQATPAPPATPPAEAAESIADVAPIENTTVAGAGKALNPDISVVGTFLSHAGDDLEGRAPAELEEVEAAFEAFIDPYAKGKFFISVGPDSVDVEEGYAQFVALPWGLTAKAGKTKATFGKVNTWHTHTRPWVDEPLMLTRFMGEEGLADVGLSVSRDIPNPFGAFMEATGEVYSGEVENVFGRSSSNDLFYNTHLKLFRDITENSNVEVGTSWARGTLPETGGRNRLAGLDVTWRWKPLSRAIYNSMIARVEGVSNRRADYDGNLYGYYASLDYQLGRRWFAGARIDRADRFEGDERFIDRGASAILTFWPSEFSQLRAQLRRTTLGSGPSFNELLLQLQFAIGAHGAHAF